MLKDLYTQKISVYIVSILWFILFTDFFTDGSPIRHIFLIMMLAFFLVLSTNGENEKTFRNESILINSLPCTRKQVVLAKYLSGLMWFGLASIAVIIYIILFDIFAPFPTRMPYISEIILALSGCYFLISVFYPVLYRAGYLVAITVSIVLPVMIIIGVQMIGNIMENPRLTSAHEFFETIISHQTSITVVFAIIILVITLLSYKVSVRIYTKIDF